MARGLADFSPSALQAQRMNLDGRPDRTSMSADALARATGTTKAQILAYENGHKVPDPPRIKALAHALKIDPRQLMDDSAQQTWTLADWRRAGGLRAQDVVTILGISPKNYRRFETEGILPSRRPQFLDEVAEVLNVPRQTVEAAMDQTPGVRERRARARELVLAMAEKYVSRPGPWRGPALDDPNLVELALAYGRPVQRLHRVLTHELGELRQNQVRALRERIIADYDTDRDRQANAQYAVDRWNNVFQRDQSLIPQRLERFHRTAQPSSLWQALVDLYTADATVRADAGTWAPAELLGKRPDELSQYMVERHLVGDVEVCRLTAQGANHVLTFNGLYAALYPTARRPMRLTTRGTPKTRSTTDTFTIPGYAERLVVPQPTIEAIRAELMSSKTAVNLKLSPSVNLSIGMKLLSTSPVEDSPQAERAYIETE
ncbi:helix-turn-helix domain-containing protein [Streptomyces sp. NPDC127084]|uniref:helix-turn-helix domain-containing protein n=1 Tax=Streptomyces sp. NPDC127084 TaxID=3347133 RepID=UPI00364DD454